MINLTFFRIHKEIIDCKTQTNYALEKLYQMRVAKVHNNIMMLQEFKIKNDYYTSFTSSILHNNMYFNDARIFK